MSYTITEAQYLALLSRVTQLESRYNDIVTAISRFTTLDQLNNLQVVIESDIALLKARMEPLEELLLDEDV